MHESALSPKVQEANELSVKFGHALVHVFHVRQLCIQIFEQLHDLHLCLPGERDLLESAALLHDIGWIISGKRHHKHSMRLIQESSLQAFDPREKQVIANIARYHRRSLPKMSHTQFSSMMPQDQWLVRKLGGILRIADAMDKSHRSRVKEVECRIEGSDCIFLLNTVEPCPHELRAIQKKKKLFCHVFSVGVKTEVKLAEESSLAYTGL